MMSKKKREFQSSELVKSFAKIYGFEDKLLAFEVKDFLKTILKETAFNELESININEKTLLIKVKSPLMKNDFRLSKTFYLLKIQENFPLEYFTDLLIL